MQALTLTNMSLHTKRYLKGGKMFIFLDIEPNDNEDSKMLEIAYMTDKHLIMNQCFNPQNNINNDGNAAIKTSKFAHQLNELLQDSGNVLVATNAQSKVSILEQKGIKPERVICTLKLARFMDRLGKFPEDNLQDLLYGLGIEQEESEVKDAFCNVFNVETLFYRLYHQFFFDTFPDGKAKKVITKRSIESINKSLEYPQPRFNSVFFDIARTNELEQALIERMVDISKAPLLITPNAFWQTQGVVKEDYC